MGQQRTETAQVNLKTHIILISLGVFTMISRVVFQVRGVESFDAINYMLAISHYDLRHHQPQPPGYILYILISRVFNLFWHDPHEALLWVSAVSSGLAVIAVFVVANELFNRNVAIFTTGVLITSTFFWFTGELAAPYPLDVFFSALIAWLCIRYINTGLTSYSWIGAVVLGLAGAFRPQTMVFLSPLFIYSLFQRSKSAVFTRPWLTMAVFAAFFIPFNLSDGRFSNYWKSITNIVPIVSSSSTFVESLFIKRFIYNIVVILRYTFDTIGEPALIFLLLGLTALFQQQATDRKRTLLFFAIWLLPTWLSYVIIWAGNQATVMITLPALMIVVGLGIDWLIKRPGWKYPGRIIFSFLVILQAAVFLFFPALPFGENYRHFDTLAVIRDRVRVYEEKIELIGDYDPQDTVVIARDFRFIQYFLPKYLAYSIPVWDPYDQNVIRTVNKIKNGSMDYLSYIQSVDLIPPNTKNLIFFDLDVTQIPFTPGLMERIEGDTAEITLIQIRPAERILWSSNGLTIVNSTP